MGFKDFQPLFGEVQPVWDDATPSSRDTLNRCLFRIYAHDSSHLKFHVTDFHSHTWESVKSEYQVEDMRDIVGIGGPVSEFIDYFVSSFKSGDVKLLYEVGSKSSGAVCAKLVAQKSKGFPLISISLSKLTAASAGDAVASLSLELYKGFRDMQHSLVKEQERSCQLTRAISAEKAKSQTLKHQLDALVPSKRQKIHMAASDNGNMPLVASSDTSTVTAGQNSTEKQQTAEFQSKKITSRSVPAYRRSKVRGAVIADTEEGEGN